MNHRVYFAVGQGFMGNGTPIDHCQLLQWRNEAMKHIASVFGGLTAVNITGAWVNSAHETVRERSWGIEIYTDSHTAEKAHAVAEWLKAKFHQESILLAISPVESLHFV